MPNIVAAQQAIQTTTLTASEFRLISSALAVLVSLVGFLIWQLFNARMKLLEQLNADREKQITKAAGDTVELAVDMDNGLTSLDRTLREHIAAESRLVSMRVDRLETSQGQTTTQYNELRITVEGLKNKFENNERALERVESGQKIVLEQISKVLASIGGRRQNDGERE